MKPKSTGPCEAPPKVKLTETQRLASRLEVACAEIKALTSERDAAREVARREKSDRVDAEQRAARAERERTDWRVDHWRDVMRVMRWWILFTALVLAALIAWVATSRGGTRHLRLVIPRRDALTMGSSAAMEAPGIHSVVNERGGAVSATVFTWPGVVPDSLYIVGMRPIKAIIYVDHDAVLDTFRLQ
jgi:hypothetical protein